MGLAVVLAFLLVGVAASPAAAVEYKRDPQLSLTGDCSTSGADPIPDPSCPYLPPPAGPTGRFKEPRSVAIDAYGNEYVASYANGDAAAARIDVFDDEGKFITELRNPTESNFGPKSLAVDSEGYLYVWEQIAGNSSEVVRYEPTVYDGAAGNVQYEASTRTVLATLPGSGNGGVAVDLSNDRLFVAEESSIGEYKSAAEGNELLGTITGPHIKWTNWVAVDSTRDRLYASFCQNLFEDCGIVVMDLDPPHAVLEEIEGPETLGNDKFLSEKGWLSTAVDEETGHFFVDDLEQTKNIYEFDENYEYVHTLTESSFVGGNALQIAVSNSPLDPSAKNHGFLFVPVQAVSGRALAFEPVNIFPPDMLQAAVDNVGETEAELSATIDPNGAATKYRLEYEVLGSGNPQVAREGTLPANGQPTAVSAIATGLSPGVSYRFRAFAENEKGSDEADTLFTTYGDAPISSDCLNHSLRIGPSALLPDCRAYELVTPPDTSGFPPKGVGDSGDLFATLHASPVGDAVTFRIVGGTLSGEEGTGSFSGDPYLTRRGPSGWTTAAAGPPGTVTNAIQAGSNSPDQGYSFWEAGEKGPAVIEPGENRYVRYPDGHSELIGQGSLGTIDPKAGGKLITENGTHIVFQTSNFGTSKARQLEPNAPPEGTTAVYDRTPDGVTHVVSLLPGDVTPAAGQNATYIGASSDGEGIAFEIANTLYLRKNNSVTYKIGEPGADFAGVSVGGARVFYVEDGNLLAYDTSSAEIVTFADTAAAVSPVNVAMSGTRAYFVSTTAIPGSGPNPEGDSPLGGQQNLYLSEEGAISFVATVTKRDVEGEVVSGLGSDGLGLWTEVLPERQPARSPSRLNPDGSVMLFQSRANLDEYDPDGAPQVYRYDSAADTLECISCLPSKTAAGEGATLQSYSVLRATPIPFGPSAFVPNITPDGRRAFFQSTEALVSTDTDGAQDVYEWEANGVGSCTRSEGCVYLISSGQSERDDYLYGHSASGDDVFFTTRDVLLASDTGGTLSIYDARVGGGFPEPVEAPCAGEGCKPPLTSPPSTRTPESGPRSQSGNVTPKAKPRKCPKGKRKVKRAGKVRCVKKKSKQERKKAGAKKKGAAR